MHCGCFKRNVEKLGGCGLLLSGKSDYSVSQKYITQWKRMIQDFLLPGDFQLFCKYE